MRQQAMTSGIDQERKQQQLQKLTSNVADKVLIEIHGKYVSQREYFAVCERLARCEQALEAIRVKMALSERVGIAQIANSATLYATSKEIIYKAIDDFGGERGLTAKEIEFHTGLKPSSIKSGIRILRQTGVIASEFNNREYYVPSKLYYIIAKRNEKS